MGDRVDECPVRSIPAWAGETIWCYCGSVDEKVYPRVGGGNADGAADVIVKRGLSPRGRGKPLLYTGINVSAGSIPAWAGETVHLAILRLYLRVYPRVGGGNEYVRHCAAIRYGLSPRGRGKLYGKRAWLCEYGSIPAWAGETIAGCMRGGLNGVYPRVGGGNPYVLHHPDVAVGLSPRGRGKRSASV